MISVLKNVRKEVLFRVKQDVTFFNCDTLQSFLTHKFLLVESYNFRNFINFFVIVPQLEGIIYTHVYKKISHSFIILNSHKIKGKNSCIEQT